MKYLIRHFLNQFSKSWWLEISTRSPGPLSSEPLSTEAPSTEALSTEPLSTEAPSTEASSSDCDYYFGPFASKNEALHSQPGYVEDLEQEGSKVSYISVVRRTTPHQLTVEYSKVA